MCQGAFWRISVTRTFAGPVALPLLQIPHLSLFRPPDPAAAALPFLPPLHAPPSQPPHLDLPRHRFGSIIGGADVFSLHRTQSVYRTCVLSSYSTCWDGGDWDWEGTSYPFPT